MRAGRRALLGALVGFLLGPVLVAGATTPASAETIEEGQWGLDAIHARDVWPTTRGEGTVVAVVDTGVDQTHPDLRGRVLPGKDLVGFGARRGDSAWASHGTAMAGIIAGRGHGPGDAEGVTGVAPRTRILPIRVILDQDDPQRRRARTTRASALPEGIRWAVDHGADVINLSLGDDSKSSHPEPAEDEAVQYALGKGVVVVASAGNGAKDGDRASYPAAYPGVISVTAVDRYGVPGDFSTRRWYSSVNAPGVDVAMADPDRRYYVGWGTSAAAAHVSGVVALIRSVHPELSPAQIKRLLETTARNSPEGGRSDALGAGLVDASAALAAAEELEPEPSLPRVSPYPGRHFGPGPQAADLRPPQGGDLPGATVAACAVTGAALLLVAGGLHLHGRRGAGR
ncbi:type VII secretion-associated serine protease mycosin [Wenjunlia vitaminophila]|uniref:Type VII secretion-associated serine protease mycosin n=1 Tax=Wenjunlia vitaminophila TaxID=76728 RepID=A0A0T6LVZ6_WENVI|nr:type VII secretion-associated serine protease mycosin [Wenjunlia vitaminophila]KRV50283.1 type VII secretion-associated serine protease mycosin [Wenjunlia vitaminophila]